MKTKWFLVPVLVGLLAMTACSTGQATGASKAVTVEVTIDQLTNEKHITKQVDIAEGGVLTVVLGSNRTTGFQWDEQAEVGDQAVLKQTGHRFIEPEASGTNPPVGAPGEEEWTFQALKKGETKVSMQYSRPWEGGEKGEWTFELTVTVK